MQLELILWAKIKITNNGESPITLSHKISSAGTKWIEAEVPTIIPGKSTDNAKFTHNGSQTPSKSSSVALNIKHAGTTIKKSIDKFT